jgi:hypothetical protein
MKLSTFKKSSHIIPDLIGAVVKQFGGKAAFKQYASDVANHGIGGGFSGFIYHTETVEFAKKWRHAILQQLKSLAEELGIGTLELIQGFGCLNNLYSTTEIMEAIYNGSDDETEVMNALAWFAAEEVCRSYQDIREENL